MNWAFAILLLVFLGGGGVLFLGATTLALRTLRFRQRASRALGVIIEAKQGEWKRAAIERHRSEGRKVSEIRRDPVASDPPAPESLWSVTVEFEDAAGAKRQGTTEAGSGRTSHKVGDRLPILYDPERPSVIRMDSFGGLWGGPLLIGILGAAFLIVGLLLWSGAIPLR